MDTETDWWLPRQREVEERWSGRLGSADRSFNTQDGQTRSYCTEQETTLDILRQTIMEENTLKMNVYEELNHCYTAVINTTL